MIDRTIRPFLSLAAEESPVVAVTGPRQSGKTTLCRATFPDYEYVSLEPLDTREFARTDPRGFLRQYAGHVVFDEIQRVPELFSYLQEQVDLDPAPGRFVLTGSQHFGLSASISQSLAGRVSILNLLPLGLDEVRRFGTFPTEIWSQIWSGGYPRIYDRRLTPDRWLADYVATYVQRDVRQVTNVGDLDTFTAFLRLAAGRTGQELNLSSLGSDVGVSYNTIRSWISVLEMSFVVRTLPPWVRNPRKRVVKAPKLHFIDSGLACHLLGIRSPEQLALHPLRGAIFESWVVSEVLKARVHRRRAADLFHLRESRGVEVDLIVDAGSRLYGVEAKSGATLPRGGTTALASWPAAGSSSATLVRRILYGGDTRQQRTDVDVVPWGQIQEVDWDPGSAVRP
jgi:hypothetical protein